jgi:hypothetical protein
MMCICCGVAEGTEVTRRASMKEWVLNGWLLTGLLLISLFGAAFITHPYSFPVAFFIMSGVWLTMISLIYACLAIADLMSTDGDLR